MELKKILTDVEYELIKGTLDIDIVDISYDSRKIRKDMAFICLIGIDTDGHNYIKQAIKNGANCIVVCKDIEPIKDDVTIIKIKDTRTELSKLSANLFDNPADKLIKIGITGTKGKTSISWILKSILEQNQDKVAITGTTGTYINNQRYEHKNTTPESYLVQKYMKQCVDENIKYYIMETSSTALKVGRINNILFDYAIFTNMSLDHIGEREHPTYEDYVNSKAKLFKQSKIGIINKDDKEYETIIANATCQIYTYGKKNADINIINIENEINTLQTKFKLEGKINHNYKISIPGTFSAYNATSAIALCKLLNISDETIQKGLEKCQVPGRCKVINIEDKAKVVIDFAHNEASIKSIITTMRAYHPNRIITIFGCGGGRSRKLRYEIGKITAELSDLCIVTTDNPRNDDIDEINKDIIKGIVTSSCKYKTIIDRKEAIEYALKNAEQNDIILLLGKGHEKYQEVKQVIYPFDEEQIINDYLRGEYESTI